ncbi:MAG: hypothetical protein ACK5MT_10135 [Actinomycetales bacterium]
MSEPNPPQRPDLTKGGSGTGDSLSGDPTGYPNAQGSASEPGQSQGSGAGPQSTYGSPAPTYGAPAAGYEAGQPGGGQYEGGQYGSGQYDPNQYDQNQYDGQQPGYGQAPQGYGQQPEYSPAGYGQPAQPEYGQTGYGQPDYGQPGYPGYDQGGYGTDQAGAAGYNYAAAGQGYGNYAPAGPSRALAIAALTLSIIALLGSWIPFVGLGFGLFALAGFIIGIVAIVQVGKGRARGRGMAITGVVLSVISVLVAVGSSVAAWRAIGTVASDYSSSYSWDSSTPGGDTGGLTWNSNTDEVLNEYLDAYFGEAEISGGPDFPDSRVPLTLTNKSSVRASFMISVAAVKDGTQTSTDFVSTDVLDPGASVSKDVFTFISSADELEGATFEVTEATFIPES